MTSSPQQAAGYLNQVKIWWLPSSLQQAAGYSATLINKKCLSQTHRKIGGQKGHPGTTRQPFSEDKVDHIEDYELIYALVVIIQYSKKELVDQLFNK
jgi:hypothetical protein